MLKIAFITELFPPHVGGQEFRFFRLAQLLSKSSKVFVYTVRYHKNLPEYEKLGNISVIRYITLENYVKPGSRAWLPLLRYITETRRVLMTIHNEFDVIIMNEMPVMHLYVTPKREKLIVDFCEVHGKGMLRVLTTNAAKCFRLATAVSDFVKASLENWNKNIKVKVIRTPFNISEYHAGPNDKEWHTVLYVGRLVKHKNILNLIRAIIELNQMDKNAKWKLIITGKGPKEIETLIRSFSSKYKFIEYLGYVSEDEKKELYRRAWLFAIPSIREGFPNAVAEAIISSTPVLTVKSPNNGIWYDAIKYGFGVVCNDITPGGLAKCIMSVTEAKYFELIEGCNRLRRQFDESYVYTKLMNFLMKVMNYEDPKEST